MLNGLEFLFILFAEAVVCVSLSLKIHCEPAVSCDNHSGYPDRGFLSFQQLSSFVLIISGTKYSQVESIIRFTLTLVVAEGL